MKILLVTDIHYGTDKGNPRHEGDTRKSILGKNIGVFLRKLEPIAQKCDLVVNLGDLIEQTKTTEEDAARYAEAMQLLDFSKPTKHVAGNHDLINLNRTALAKIIIEPAIKYSFDLEGYHHIVLDGNRDGNISPKLEPFRFDYEQIEWLKKDLDSTSLPVIVYSHYPIDEYDLEENPIYKTLDKGMAFPQNSEKVKDLLEKSEKVLIVLSGHMHFQHQQITNNIIHTVVGSFSRNAEYDNDLQEINRPTTEYTIVTITGGKVLVENKYLVVE